jgi:hypothetical protein
MPVTHVSNGADAWAAAEYVEHFMFTTHRGAYRTHDAVIVFGNDGYRTDPRSQAEAELVRQYLDCPNQKNLIDPNYPPEFAVSADGYTWVFVWLDYGQRWKEDGIEDLVYRVWAAWEKACEDHKT